MCCYFFSAVQVDLREVTKKIQGMDKRIIVSLVGSLVVMGLFFLMLWFVIPRPNNIDVPVVVEDGDAVVNTIGNAYTLIDLHSINALWSGSTLVIVFVGLLVTGCCCKNKALKSVHSHLSVKLKDEFTALLSDCDSSKLDRKQESTPRQGQLESRAQRERARLDMEALDAEEARLERQEVYQRRAQLAERKRQGEYNLQQGAYGDRAVAYVRHPGRGAEGGVQYTGGVEPNGDYHVVVPVEQGHHQAMVHQPQGGVMRGRTSARYGVDISHLSADGQRIYSEMQ